VSETVNDAPFFVLVCEGHGDVRVARGFAERVLLDAVEYLEMPEARPDWRGLEPGSAFFQWSQVKEKYRDGYGHPGFKSERGRFAGLSKEPDAVAGFSALRLAHRTNCLGIVLMRDTDNQPERLGRLQVARARFHREVAEGFPVVVSVASPKRENWLLAGYQPESDVEQRLYRALCKLIGFDAAQRPHALNSNEDDDAKNPKIALSKHLQLDHEQEYICWERPSLDTLHKNGKDCGLSDYLYEVKNHLVPLFLR
jgi:hypothetical protein